MDLNIVITEKQNNKTNLCCMNSRIYLPNSRVTEGIQYEAFILVTTVMTCAVFQIPKALKLLKLNIL